MKPKTFSIEGFKLITPRLQTTLPQKQNSVDDWQHPLSQKPIKTTSQENDSTNTHTTTAANTRHFRGLVRTIQECPR